MVIDWLTDWLTTLISLILFNFLVDGLTRYPISSNKHSRSNKRPSPPPKKSAKRCFWMSAFSRPLNFLNNTGIGRFRSANENVRQILCPWYINKNQRSGRKLLNLSCVFSSSLVIFLACTQTLFYFSFRSFRKHRRARSARKKNIERLLFSSPTTTSLRWRSINPFKKK